MFVIPEASFGIGVVVFIITSPLTKKRDIIINQSRSENHSEMIEDTMKVTDEQVFEGLSGILTKFSVHPPK